LGWVPQNSIKCQIFQILGDQKANKSDLVFIQAVVSEHRRHPANRHLWIILISSKIS
jgi:hypothetical protein